MEYYKRARAAAEKCHENAVKSTQK